MAKAKKSKKVTFAGRPAGAPNQKSMFLRNIPKSIRMSEGMAETLKALVATGSYKSEADVLHEAVQQLGFRKLSIDKDIYWLNQIQ